MAAGPMNRLFLGTLLLAATATGAPVQEPAPGTVETATIPGTEIEFDGVRRVCHMACAVDANEGDYVIVHAGIAICRVDPDEAERVFRELEVLGDDEGWKGDAS